MPSEFQTVVDNHYQNLYRFAISLTKSTDDAWDLTQESFLRLAKKRASIRSAKAIKSWLYTTLYREFLRIAKKSSRYDSIEDLDTVETTEHVSPEQFKNAEANDVLNALLELKFVYRQVVTLYYLESYSYKEIATILEIPIGTVMSRLARGKDILKKTLTKPAKQRKIIPFSSKQRRASNG